MTRLKKKERQKMDKKVDVDNDLRMMQLRKLMCKLQMTIKFYEAGSVLHIYETKQQN